MADSNDNSVSLWSCCNDGQSLFLLLYLAFCLLAMITWKSIVAKPLRLMSVFLHELSHAVACWITGGRVYSMQVYDNEGGVTQYSGGCRCLIIPAGYVGVSIWAMVFVVLSGGLKTATAAAIVLMVAFLVALCTSPNKTLVYVCLVYFIITAVLVYVEWMVEAVTLPLLQLVILFYGVLIGLFAMADIYDDTIQRTIVNSDAYACHKEVWPCCQPKCVGLQWALVAAVFQIMGIIIALAQMSDECEDLGWWQCLNSSRGEGGGGHGEWNFLSAENFQDWDFQGFWEQHGWNNHDRRYLRV